MCNMLIAIVSLSFFYPLAVDFQIPLFIVLTP